MSLNKGKDTPVYDETNIDEDSLGILFFRDERKGAASNASSSSKTLITELGAASPLENLRKSVSRTVEEAKKEEAEKEQEKEQEKKDATLPERETVKPAAVKRKKSSSLLAKCMPYIYDEQGVNCAEEKPDYTLESVEEIIESAEKRADERIARMYNLKPAEVQRIGTDKEAESKPEAETKPKLTLQETSVTAPIETAEQPFSAAKLFEPASVPKVSDTLFDDFSGRRTDVIGKEKVISAYSAQGGMDSAVDSSTKIIPELKPEENSNERYEDILSHTRPVNIEDISSSSKKPTRAIELTSVEEDDIEVDDYCGEKDISRVGSMLKAAAFVAKLKLFATALLTAVSVFLVLPSVREELEAITLGIIAVVVFVLALLVNANVFAGFKGAFTKKTAIELPLAAALTVVAVYFVYNIILGSYPSEITVLPLASLLVYDYCAYRKAKAIFGNFKIVAVRRSKKALCLIDDATVTSAMARGSVSGEVVAIGEQETDEIGDFLKHTLSDRALSGRAGVFTVFSMICALVIGVAVGVSSASLSDGILAAATVLCLGAAPTLFIADMLPFSSLCDRLFRSRAAVCSKGSAEKIEQANAMVVSSKELFPDGTIKLYNMTPLSANPLDETLVLAAAVAMEAGSPLYPIFKKILSKDISVPEADSVKYEDTLGISGWVGDSHVLIGNRSLMQAHGVRVPALEVDRKILHKGYFPVYVATEQRACALLVVGYLVDRELEHRLGKLNDRGVTILVNNCDPNITEQMLCDYYSLYPDLVKIMDHNGVDKYLKATPHAERVSAHAFHRGDFDSLLNIVLGSGRLRLLSAALYVIHIIAAVGSWTLFAVLSLGGTVGFVGAGLCAVFELVALIVSLMAYFIAK